MFTISGPTGKKYQIPESSVQKFKGHATHLRAMLKSTKVNFNIQEQCSVQRSLRPREVFKSTNVSLDVNLKLTFVLLNTALGYKIDLCTLYSQMCVMTFKLLNMHCSQNLTFLSRLECHTMGYVYRLLLSQLVMVA